MGLDTTFDCWHGSYGGFSRWRNEVARAAGYTITADPERPGSETYAIVREPCWTFGNFRGEWHDDPPDPLLVLLIHSDCDGKIAKRHQLALADRLDEIALNMVGDDRIWAATSRFAAGLRAANAAGKAVKFR